MSKQADDARFTVHVHRTGRRPAMHKHSHLQVALAHATALATARTTRGGLSAQRVELHGRPYATVVDIVRRPHPVAVRSTALGHSGVLVVRVMTQRERARVRRLAAARVAERVARVRLALLRSDALGPASVFGPARVRIRPAVLVGSGDARSVAERARDRRRQTAERKIARSLMARYQYIGRGLSYHAALQLARRGVVNPTWAQIDAWCLWDTLPGRGGAFDGLFGSSPGSRGRPPLRLAPSPVVNEESRPPKSDIRHVSTARDTSLAAREVQRLESLGDFDGAKRVYDRAMRGES